jgi:hypothetical protein
MHAPLCLSLATKQERKRPRPRPVVSDTFNQMHFSRLLSARTSASRLTLCVYAKAFWKRIICKHIVCNFSRSSGAGSKWVECLPCVSNYIIHTERDKPGWWMQRVHRSPQTEEREGSTRRRCISVQLKFNRGYIWSRGVIRRHRHLGTRRSTHAASRRPRTALSAIKTEWANAYAKWLITPSGAANEARGLHAASFMFL